MFQVLKNIIKELHNLNDAFLILIWWFFSWSLLEVVINQGYLAEKEHHEKVRFLLLGTIISTLVIYLVNNSVNGTLSWN